MEDYKEMAIILCSFLEAEGYELEYILPMFFDYDSSLTFIQEIEVYWGYKQ